MIGFEFQVDPGDSHDGNMLTSRSPDQRQKAAVRPAKILIVEDDYFVALDIEHFLKDAGFQIVGIARTAIEAEALAGSLKPDLAIMDIRLIGEKDGVETAIHLATQLKVRSIFATAHSDEATRTRAREAQPAGWLQKPYSSDALIGLINKAISDI